MDGTPAQRRFGERLAASDRVLDTIAEVPAVSTIAAVAAATFSLSVRPHASAMQELLTRQRAPGVAMFAVTLVVPTSGHHAAFQSAHDASATLGCL